MASFLEEEQEQEEDTLVLVYWYIYLKNYKIKRMPNLGKKLGRGLTIPTLGHIWPDPPSGGSGQMCPRVGIVRPLLRFFQGLAQTEVRVAVKEWVFRQTVGAHV